MTPTPRLVLFGNSVFLAGIKAQLKTSRHVELIAVGTENSDVVDLIRRRNPTAVIFDLSAGYPDFATSLLRDQPGLLLIGMMPSSDEMFLLSGRYARAQSIEDLLQVTSGLPASNRETRSWFDGKRLRDLIAYATTLIPTRRQKLAIAVTLIGLCSILIFALEQSLDNPSATAPLVGTAESSGTTLETAFAFGIGIILGAVFMGAWFYLRQARKIMHQDKGGGGGY